MSANRENFGRSMLEKMGWSEGTGLGAKRDGIVEPIAPKSRPEKLGVGAERPPFEDAWWERMLVEAYGTGTKDVDDKNLLEACEGRRCRPHGTAKLDRIARQDAGMSVEQLSHVTPVAESCISENGRQTNKAAKSSKKRRRKEETLALSPQKNGDRMKEDAHMKNRKQKDRKKSASLRAKKLIEKAHS